MNYMLLEAAFSSFGVCGCVCVGVVFFCCNYKASPDTYKMFVTLHYEMRTNASLDLINVLINV